MVDGSAQCDNSINSFNILRRLDEDAEIMHWLSPPKLNRRYRDVRTHQFDGIRDWLLETNEFREWRDGEGGSEKAVLFCPGKPGAGKEYLSSLVIDSLRDRASGEDIAVVGLYFDYAARSEHSITNLIKSTLKQLAAQEGIPDCLREAFIEVREEIGGRGLRPPDLMGILWFAISPLCHVFICTDAPVECHVEHSLGLLRSPWSIVRGSPPGRIFLTGRSYIGDRIQGHFSKAVVIPIIPNMDGTRSHADVRPGRNPEPEAMDDDLRVDIMRTVSEKTPDTFLPVSLNIDDFILDEVTIRQRRKLEEMAQGNELRDVYTATLTRLKAQKGNKSILGLKVLMWVLYSERPLRAEELCHALAVEMGSMDLDLEKVPGLQALLACSLGLVTVEASSSTLQLAHFTLRECLLSDSILFHCPHSMIAEVCLTYLNFVRVWELSSTLYSDPSTMPLLEYASCYWGKHARREMTENVKILALRLLNRFDQHISAQIILAHYSKDRNSGHYFYGTGKPTGFTGLHGAAVLGIPGIVATILETMEQDVNATDVTGNTALAWAARGGYERIVKILLEQESVNPDSTNTRYGQTPLSWAAERGHEGVVRMLLERNDVNPDRAETGSGQTPLSRAAGGGHEGVVRMLLERNGVNPDRADTGCGRAPLSWAAGGGHEGVVRMLLERKDVNPDRADTGCGRTPLLWATGGGHEGVVRMILERKDVNPDRADTGYGRTPLSWASGHGHEGAVRMLLEREDVNPDRADTGYGRTPLSWAAGNGNEGVIKILLEQKDVNPDQADSYGQSPLLWATSRRYEGVVKLLLERRYSAPNHAVSIASSTDRSRLPHPSFPRIPISWFSPGEHNTPVYNILLALRIATDMCFLITILFFLSYFLNLSGLIHPELVGANPS